MKHVKSLDELQSKLTANRPSWIFIYKKGSFASNCSSESLMAAAAENPSVEIFMVDVNTTGDIHPVFGINSAPTLFLLDNNKVVNMVKGCQSVDYYSSLLKNSLFTADGSKSEKPQKRVTVYTSPSCSWCTVVKSHLKQHQVRFSEVDISADSNAAQNLFRKSGQLGVPQTDINGEIVVGFNKTRINQLLGIL